ncbi:MAG: hypothetical protein JNK58_08340 [Phycisphaerae bacterium]|nr:hypothetical protein [Phycisphaerae bacterium]
MIRRALGCTFGSCVMVLAGATALGAGGYMTMTGKSLCSVVSACGEKSNTAQNADNKNVTTASAKEGSAKSCCPLGKTVAAAAKSGECAKTCSSDKVASAKRGFYMMGGSVPVAMPAMFYNNKASFCTASLKEVGGCNTPCADKAKVETVAAKQAASGCCKGKTAAVETVAAKDGAAPAGCCKGSGTRPDGTPCQKDGPHCDQGAKEAQKAPEAEKAGEPVASRQ